MTIEDLYKLYVQYPAVCTDTRNIKPDSVFFALKGEKFNANAFAANALELGAKYVVIDEADYKVNDSCILVDDVLKALQDLAKVHRKHLAIPVIGITGSNGKTTTKELVNAVLCQRYKTFATQGNLNNHIGVPLSILSIGQETEIAIIEMGANHQKEIEFLCSMAMPSYGIITNVGKAHLEGFGGYEGVKIAKGELYQYLAQTGGTAFINRDNRELMAMSRTADVSQVVYYNQGADGFISGILQRSEPFLVVEWKRELMEFDDHSHIAQSNLTGKYNLENVLAAICIGSFFELSADEINQGIAAYVPANNRSQITKTDNNTLICDYYNANPSSMAVAIENIGLMPGEQKVILLGDMFELGEESAAEHKAVAQKAARTEAYRHIFIGEEFYKLASSFDGEFYRTTADALKVLTENPVKDSLVLLKGSRGMKLEELLPAL